jgi:hypothetical protein
MVNYEALIGLSLLGYHNSPYGRGAVCIDNATDTSSMAMSRTFRGHMSQRRALRGLYSHHTGSHYIGDPLDTGPYIQKDNI